MSAVPKADELPGGKPFVYLVFFTPLLVIVDFPPTQLVGLTCRGYVLTRPWSSARHDGVLVAFLGTALAVMAADQVGGRDLRQVTVPFTGWLATPPYDVSLFFAVVAGVWGTRQFRLAVVAMCVLQFAWGLAEWVLVGARESSNPYLRISPWRPLWTVVFPAVWAVALAATQRRVAVTTERVPP